VCRRCWPTPVRRALRSNHLSYLPHSGSVLPALASELTGYEGTRGSLHFAIDEPLPRDLVDKLLTARMKQLGLL
jgi:uncharacterized protein YdhG (YjbR/CyaY superfamily)